MPAHRSAHTHHDEAELSEETPPTLCQRLLLPTLCVMACLLHLPPKRLTQCLDEVYGRLSTCACWEKVWLSPLLQEALLVPGVSA